MKYQTAITRVGGKLFMLSNKITPKATNDGIHNEMFLLSQRYVTYMVNTRPSIFRKEKLRIYCFTIIYFYFSMIKFSCLFIVDMHKNTLFMVN